MPAEDIRGAMVRALLAPALAVAMVMAACGDSSKSVALSWTANRESGVNKAGGGYEVTITGRPAIDVPYVSGTSAPTTTTVSLPSGNYTVTVRAYAALDAQGTNTKTLSAPSQPVTVTVP
jgi:hypothetical protein